MRRLVSSQPHLEDRPTGYHWRRRFPARVMRLVPWAGKMSLLFPLRTHFISDAKAIARNLTILSDIAFAGVTERTMAIAPDIMDTLLVRLGRFLVDAAEAARELAPQRTPEVAAAEWASTQMAIETLRQAIALRNRDIARDPLRHVAAGLGLALDESDPDWARLAYRALRVMIDAESEGLKRDQGVYAAPSIWISAAPPTAPASALHPASCTLSPSATDHVPGEHRSCRTTKLVGDDNHQIICGNGPSKMPGNSIRRSEPIPTAPTFANPPVHAASVQVKNADPAIRISDTTERYIELRCLGYSSFLPKEQPDAKAGNSWKKNSAPNVKSTGRLLARILDDRPFSEISDQDLTQAFCVMARLPRNYQAATDKRDPLTAADEIDAEECRLLDRIRDQMKDEGASPGRVDAAIHAARIPRLKAATIYRHMQDFQRICRFLVTRGDLDRNLMEGHIWTKGEYDRRVLEEEDSERLTWCALLPSLLRSEVFQSKPSDPGEPLFWAPLIALHTGFRSEEVLQLNISDIEIIDEIPCITLRQGAGQNLKSRAARRTVPLHRNLLDLGLMELVALRRRQGEPRLFPWVERGLSKRTYTENFSRAFTAYRRKHGVYDPQRDFHSFRTTFNHRLIEAECPDTQR